MELRRTPFHAQHLAAGGRLVPFAGFELPVRYGSLKAEHRAVRARAGLFDVSHMGEVRVTGPRAEDALTWLLSNAIRKIAPGQAQYNAMCNERGGVVDDVFVYRLAPDDFLVCVNASNRARDFAWMASHNPYGATLVDEGDAWAQLAIQGPAAAGIADALTPADLTAVPRRGLVQAPFAGVDACVIARTGYTGEDGFEVFLPAAHAEPAWDAVLSAGAGAGIVPCGLGARDTLRLEAGNCLYGHELTDETTPVQAGLGWITKLRKPGGFVGSEAITRRIETDTHALAALVLAERAIPREGMVVLSDGRPVGTVTSGTLAPWVERPIAFAYVERALSRPGTSLQVDVRGRAAAATVHQGSFLALAPAPSQES